MDLKQAQDEFLALIDRVNPKDIGDFLAWVKISFTTKEPLNEAQDQCEQEAALQAIIGELRSKVPLNAVLPSERTLFPEYGTDSDCDPNTTVHIDSFLYDDDGVDELVSQGLLSRQYCRACGSHSTAPLTFISHSLALNQLRYIFTKLLPAEMLAGKVILDVGSRMGAVLYSAYLYSPQAAKIIGVEMNADLFQIQQQTIVDHAMADRVAVICDDIRNRASELSQSDVIVLNNVFQFFLPPQEQKLCWQFVKNNCKKGSVLVTNPSLQTLTGHLEMDFSVQDWVDEIDSKRTAATYAGTDQDLYEDLQNICLYQVK